MFNKLVTSGQRKVCCFLKVKRSRLLWPPVSKSNIFLVACEAGGISGRKSLAAFAWRLRCQESGILWTGSLFSIFFAIFHSFPKQRACPQVKKAVTWARGRCTPLYKPYRYVPTQRVGLLHRFGLENRYTLFHFGLESVMVQGSYRSVRTYLLFQFQNR